MTDYYRIPSVLGASLNFGVNGTAYAAFFTADYGSIANTTEANVQVKHQIASKLKNLRLYVSSNNATVTTTVKIRINGADGQNSVSISSGATGWFEDTTNTDTTSAGDKICYSLSKADANTVVIKNLVTDVLATSAYQKGGYYTGGSTLSTASTTRYFPFGGSVDSATEGINQKRRIRSSCTGKNLQVYVSSNPRSTTTTVRSRVNGADGNQVISISASATGWFEDTSNTDTLAQDDDYCASITTGTGSGSLVVQHVSADIQGTTSTSIAAGPSGGTLSTNQTRYWSPTGGMADTAESTEANASIKFRGTGTISKLAVGASANSSNQTTTFTARKNSADQSPTCTIAASTTGFGSDNSNSFTYADGDLLAVKGVRASGGTGTIATTWIAFELAPDAESIGGGGGTFTPYYNLLLQNLGSGFNV